MKNVIYRCLCALILFSFALPSFTQETIPVDVKIRKRKGDKLYFEDWKTFDTRIVSKLQGFNPAPVEYTKYGSIPTVKGTKTGFFHIEKIDGRSWMVDPEGYGGIGIYLNSINRGKSDRNIKAYKEKFSGSSDWMAKTIELLREHGFNGIGNWSDVKAIRQYNTQAERPMPYCVGLNMMSGYGKKRGGTYQRPGNTGYPNQCIFVFDPEFEMYCMERAKELVQYAQDPNLIGYFSDNEMPLSKKNLEGYLDLPKEEPGYLAATQWMKDKGLSRELITDEHREEFVGLVAEKYYSVVAKAIKTHDPNHMYIGSRLHAGAPYIRSVVEACGRHADIVTINYYSQWEVKKHHINNWKEWTDAPFQITEFYTKGEDTGLPNLSGAGWMVRTQKDRGYAYQNFCLPMLQADNCVGWHFFKYIDNDPTYTKVDPSNADANKGIVDNYYQPYTDMLDLMKELNANYAGLIRFLTR